MNITYCSVKAAFEKNSYPFVESEGYLNIVGFRNTTDLQANTFNDVLCVCWIEDGRRQVYSCQMTTDPGTYYRLHPANVDGCAIVMPGHYKNLWARGLHKGQYPALVQINPITVCRDNNADSNLEFTGKIQHGLFGINLHRAQESDEFNAVNKWSAGCQVIARNTAFKYFMNLVEKSKQQQLSYTLFNDFDLE